MQGQGVYHLTHISPPPRVATRRVFFELIKRDKPVTCTKCEKPFFISSRNARISYKKNGSNLVCKDCFQSGKSELAEAMKNLALRKQVMKSTKRK